MSFRVLHMGCQPCDPFGVLAIGVAHANGCDSVGAHSQLLLLAWCLLATAVRDAMPFAVAERRDPV